MLVAQSCLTLCDPMDYSPTRLLCPRNSSGMNTGVGSHSLLQEIFPTQGLNPVLLHCRQILYHLISPGKLQRSHLPVRELNPGLTCDRWGYPYLHSWLRWSSSLGFYKWIAPCNCHYSNSQNSFTVLKVPFS